MEVALRFAIITHTLAAIKGDVCHLHRADSCFSPMDSFTWKHCTDTISFFWCTVIGPLHMEVLSCLLSLSRSLVYPLLVPQSFPQASQKCGAAGEPAFINVHVCSLESVACSPTSCTAEPGSYLFCCFFQSDWMNKGFRFSFFEIFIHVYNVFNYI